MKYYSAAHLLMKLKARTDGAKQCDVARELGIVPQYLNDVLRGRRDISRRLASALGYDKLPDRYQRKGRDAR